jgi:hypothetical protein
MLQIGLALSLICWILNDPHTRQTVTFHRLSYTASMGGVHKGATAVAEAYWKGFKEDCRKCGRRENECDECEELEEIEN